MKCTTIRQNTVESLACVPLLSLWPNLVRTNTTGQEGISGNLFYGGHGEHSDFDGHEMWGAVVMLEFNSWKNWKNAAALGAAAIIFIEPGETTADDRFTLMKVECLGSCGTAPVVQINKEYHEGLSTQNFDKLLESFE